MARLVLLGGGHSHIEVLRRAAAVALPADIILVEPYPVLPYTGMVPGYIAGRYQPADLLIDLQLLCRRAGAAFRQMRAIGIDAPARTVHCDDGSALAYDLLSVDIGSTLDLSVPGAAEHAVPVRPLWGFVQQWGDRARRGGDTVVVGAGAAGIELALSVQARARQQPHRPRVSVVGDAPVIAAGLAPAARRRLEHACGARGIRLFLGQRVARVTADAVVLADGASIPAGTVLWATGPAPHPWLREGGLALDPAGYIAVDECLRAAGRTDVYAAGDVASIAGHARPKAGVYAVREGPVLFDNLCSALDGRPPRAYFPQRRALALLGTGDGRAVAAYGALAAEGAWVWRWKDSIDRRFVRRYR